MRTLPVTVAGLAVLVAACASPPPLPEELRYLAMDEAPIAELLGLSQDELLVRLGGEPSGDFIVTDVWLRDGAVIARAVVYQMIRDACVQDLAFPYRRSADLTRPYAEGPQGGVFEAWFRDGAFTGFASGAPGDAPATYPADTVIRLECNASGGSAPPDPFLPIAILALPITLPVAAAAGAQADSRRDLLSNIRLGAPPPDGLDAFLNRHADDLIVAEHTGGNARFSLPIDDFGRAEEGVAHISVENGLVSGIEVDGFYLCRLTEENSLRCGPAGTPD